MKTQTQKQINERQLFLNEIFNYGYEKGLDPYAKPVSKWLMKKHWSYNKEERKAYNLGYRRGLKVFDKINCNEL